MKGQTVNVKYHHMTDHLSRSLMTASQKAGGTKPQKHIINGQALHLKAKKEKLENLQKHRRCARSRPFHPMQESTPVPDKEAEKGV